MRSVGYAPAIVKWDNTCHSQHHGTEPPVHYFCCSHYIFSCFLSISLYFSPSLSLPLSSLSLSLPLPFSLSMSLCGCKTRVIWCPLPSSTAHMHGLSHVSSSESILLFTTYPSIAHLKNHQPFTDNFLRLPYSELLEKRLFRSRANRRLVFFQHFIFALRTWHETNT